MRPKTISREQFDPVRERDWTPVRLEGNARPDFASGMHDETFHCFIASGQHRATPPPSREVPSANIVIGGFDIYRHAPDDPLALNKDHYEVLECADEDVLLVHGPFRDGDHWIDEVPPRFQNIEVLGVSRRDGAVSIAHSTARSGPLRGQD